jgi:predicted GNAT family acetyltransferase
MSTLCARLLNEIPRLSLYVNDFNVGAIRLYERLGFQRAFDHQSIFLSPE